MGEVIRRNRGSLLQMSVSSEELSLPQMRNSIHSIFERDSLLSPNDERPSRNYQSQGSISLDLQGPSDIPLQDEEFVISTRTRISEITSHSYSGK